MCFLWDFTVQRCINELTASSEWHTLVAHESTVNLKIELFVNHCMHKIGLASGEFTNKSGWMLDDPSTNVHDRVSVVMHFIAVNKGCHACEI
jgi:hypothetical protein